MRGARQGVVVEESRDTGPFPLVKVLADGKRHDVTILNMTGLSGSPLKDSPVLLLPVEGQDDILYGIIAGPPTAARVDQQKPGEVDVRNHKRGQSIRLTDDGSVKTEAKAHVETTADGHVLIKTKAGNTIKEHADGSIGIEPAGGKKVFVGSLDGAGCHRVATEGGLSTNVYAKV